ncbi:type II secretion system protein [bacterium]|nr:type II secretion system protein [bacterium]
MDISKKFREKKQRIFTGFTIIEMMVTLSIITVLLTMMLAYNRKAEKINYLNRAVNKVLFEVKRAQEQAMLVWQSPATSQKICGWGLYWDKNNLPQNKFILFKDFCEEGKNYGDNKYSKDEQEEVILLKEVVITETNVESLCFVPPDPKLYFYPSLGGDRAELTLCLENQPNICYRLTISPSGQISKQPQFSQ